MTYLNIMDAGSWCHLSNHMLLARGVALEIRIGWSYERIDMPLARDLLHPFVEGEKKKTQKWLIQSPNFYFMGVKYPSFCKITGVFSHAWVVVLCVDC